MKQTERASIMRVLVDLIEADGIIDTRELVSLDELRAKYSIGQDDEKLSATYTFADALQVLSKASIEVRHGLLTDFESVAMSDNFCAREEALLILALRCCLTIGQEDTVKGQGVQVFRIFYKSKCAFKPGRYSPGCKRLCTGYILDS